MRVPGKRILARRTLAISAGLTEDEPVKSDKTPAPAPPLDHPEADAVRQPCDHRSDDKPRQA